MTDHRSHSRPASSLALDLTFLVVATVGLGLFAFQPGPNFDELYHILAARSYAQDGDVEIVGGAYTRAILFTKSLGLVFSVLGDGLQTAKLLPLAGAVLLMVAVFCWVRATFGRPEAWVAVLLFALSPGALYVMQFVRFYSWHALFIWGFSIAFLTALSADISLPKRALLLLLGLVCWALGYHLQPTTLIASLGFGVWAVVMWGPGISLWILRRPRGGWILLALFGLALVALAGLVYAGIPQHFWSSMRYTSPWQRPLQNDVLYYLRYFLGTFPIFFTLLPVAILVVIRRNLPAGLLCGSMLFVVLAVHTMAGPKNYKYLHYAMPFFFVLWGVTLVEVWPAVCRLAGAAAARLGELVPTSRRPGRGSTAAVLVLLIGFVLLTNGAYIRSAVFLFIGDQRVQWSIEGWEAAAERFRPELDDVDLVATSNGLFALYYLGRYDVDISPSQVSESSTGKEFGRDVRTGSYAISKPESLALLMDCYRSGLYISDSVWRWRQPHVGVSDEMADFLDSHAEAIDLPKDWMIRAYRWTRPEGQPVPDNCPVLPGH